MAKQVGPFVVVGSFGNISFYKMADGYYARRKGGPSRATILEWESCEFVRQNNREFGCAAMVGKLLRTACNGQLTNFGDRYLTGRLNGQLKRVCQLGEGERGKRTLSLARYGEALTGFEVNGLLLFGDVFGLANAVRVIKTENGLTVSLPAFTAAGVVHAPVGATHFQFTCVAVWVADYVWDNVNGVYMSCYPEWNGLEVEKTSAVLSVHQHVPELHFEMPFNGQFPAEIAVVICLGIEFFDDGHELKEGRAMLVLGMSSL